MAFASYTALRDAIVAWADNQDVTTQVDTFIALCHIRLNRVLRLEEMTVLAYTDTVVGSPWVAKPDGYLGMRRLKLDQEPGGGLDSIPFSELDESPTLNQRGKPAVYAILGDRIRLGPVPNAVWTLETAYFKQVPTLTATNTTNVFLSTVSDLLLFGSLLEAEPYLKDHEMFGTWQQQFAQGLADRGVLSEAQRFPFGDLAMRAV